MVNKNTKEMYNCAKAIRAARGAFLRPHELKELVQSVVWDSYGYGLFKRETSNRIADAITTYPMIDTGGKKIPEWYFRHAALKIGGAAPSGDLPSDRSVRKVMAAIHKRHKETWDARFEGKYVLSPKERWKIFYRFCRSSRGKPHAIVCLARFFFGEKADEAVFQARPDRVNKKVGWIYIYRPLKIIKFWEEQGGNIDIMGAASLTYEHMAIPLPGKLTA